MVSKHVTLRNQRDPRRNYDRAFFALCARRAPEMTPEQRAIIEELKNCNQYMPSEREVRIIGQVDKLARWIAITFCKGCPAACCHKSGGTAPCFFLGTDNRCVVYSIRPLTCRMYACPERVPKERFIAKCKELGVPGKMLEDVPLPGVVPRTNPAANNHTGRGLDS